MLRVVILQPVMDQFQKLLFPFVTLENRGRKIPNLPFNRSWNTSSLYVSISQSCRESLHCKGRTQLSVWACVRLLALFSLAWLAWFGLSLQLMLQIREHFHFASDLHFKLVSTHEHNDQRLKLKKEETVSYILVSAYILSIICDHRKTKTPEIRPCTSSSAFSCNLLFTIRSLMDYCVHVSALSVSHATRLQEKVSGSLTGPRPPRQGINGRFSHCLRSGNKNAFF